MSEYRVGRAGRFAAAVLAVAALPTAAFAAGPTKEQCLDAHGRGQDAREQGEVSLARKLFLTCAQSSCPSAVQGDCARFSEDLDRLQPTVSFGARDSSLADMPDTTVYVDGVLVATRLDDGKIHDVDPGRHSVKFVNGSREVTVTLVINQGEKGRPLIATFPSPVRPAAAGGGTTGSAPSAPPPEPKRPVGPLVLAGVGGAMIAGGVVMAIVGLGKVPGNCSLSSHDCAAPPGDPSFDTAKSAVTLADIGVGVGVAGAAALTSGLVWYFANPKVIQQGRLVTPWFDGHAAGIGFSGSM